MGGRRARTRRVGYTARRAMIVEAALEVFAERGYHAASLDEIARRAGITKPVLYDHFESRRPSTSTSCAGSTRRRWGAVNGLVRWWHDHRDVPAQELREVIVDVLWPGLERVMHARDEAGANAS